MSRNHASWNEILSDPEKRDTYIRFVSESDRKIGAFLSFDPEIGHALAHTGTGSLAGMPCAVKDNIAVKGFPLTCGSKILENMVSPYTATAVLRLLQAGVTVVGKTNMDEFGMGSSTDTSALGVTSNPYDAQRVAGGSSGGSAAAVAAGMVPFALGSDTGGSIRQPAGFCGVYGLKPTYGSVSRYGLVSYASSLDVIGAISRDIELLENVFRCIRGIDPRDHSSLDYDDEQRASGGAADDDAPVRRIGFLSEETGLADPVRQTHTKTIDDLRSLGYEVVPVELPSLEYVAPAYYTIATAEASANLARFTGIRYGYRPEYAENPDELVRRARDEAFGDEVKLRILLGTFVLRSGFQDQYYLKAQKIRTAIRNDFARAFTDVDLVLSPVFPTQAFRHGNEELTALQQKHGDRFTATANLAALPALAFPAAVTNGLPIGMQFLAPPFRESRLFKAARRYAEVFPVPSPPDFPGFV
jgi:aspartyl-tRNA(Asn)/glutamyl-tRNA(Gln) amidotransferase subunit A